MEFKEDDQCYGSHGTVLTRNSEGRWLLPSGYDMCGDDTVGWLVSLDITYPEPPDRGPGKISKTEPIIPPVFQYRWRIKQ